LKVKHQEFIQAKKCIEEAEFDNALKLLDFFEKKKTINTYDKLSSYHLKGQVLIWQSKNKEANTVIQEMYKLSQLYNYSLQSIDALILLSRSYMWQFEDDKSFNLIMKVEKLLKKFSHESPEHLLGKRAHLLFCQGIIFYHKGNLKQALKYIGRSIFFREEIGNKGELAESLYYMASILTHDGKFDLGLEFVERSLTLATESKNVVYKGRCYLTLGVINIFKGKINEGLANFEKSLAIFKKIKNETVICGLLNNISIAYDLKGELNQALDYLEQSLAINETIDIKLLKINTLGTAIQIALEINDVNRAKIHFQTLKKINDQEDNDNTNFVYLYYKALLLKSSSLKSDQIRASEILKEIVGKKSNRIFWKNFDYLTQALLNLCDILLTELHDTSNLEIFDQIQLYIKQILDIAKNQKLRLLLVESYLLYIKFDLIRLDLNKAQKTLIKAQKVIEKYGMNQLGKRLSIQQKIILKQKNNWVNLKDSDQRIVELANLVPLKEQIKYMLKKREIFKKLV